MRSNLFLIIGQIYYITKKMFVKGILKCLVDFTENYGAKLCKLAEMLIW